MQPLETLIIAIAKKKIMLFYGMKALLQNQQTLHNVSRHRPSTIALGCCRVFSIFQLFQTR